MGIFKDTPACYPDTMQSEVHLDILQILDRSSMQCPELTCHLVQEGICKMPQLNYNTQERNWDEVKLTINNAQKPKS